MLLNEDQLEKEFLVVETLSNLQEYIADEFIVRDQLSHIDFMPMHLQIEILQFMMLAGIYFASSDLFVLGTRFDKEVGDTARCEQIFNQELQFSGIFKRASDLGLGLKNGMTETGSILSWFILCIADNLFMILFQYGTWDSDIWRVVEPSRGRRLFDRDPPGYWKGVYCFAGLQGIRCFIKVIILICYANVKICEPFAAVGFYMDVFLTIGTQVIVFFDCLQLSQSETLRTAITSNLMFEALKHFFKVRGLIENSIEEGEESELSQTNWLIKQGDGDMSERCQFK